jgi:hypothetical protein
MNAFRFALLISLTLTLSTHKTKPMGIDTTKKNSARRNSKEESKFPGLNDYETFIAAQKMFERFDDHRKTIKNAEDLTPLKFTDDAEQVVQ